MAFSLPDGKKDTAVSRRLCTGCKIISPDTVVFRAHGVCLVHAVNPEDDANKDGGKENREKEDNET